MSHLSVAYSEAGEACGPLVGNTDGVLLIMEVVVK
jgi:hypothetical protein